MFFKKTFKQYENSSLEHSRSCPNTTLDSKLNTHKASIEYFEPEIESSFISDDIEKVNTEKSCRTQKIDDALKLLFKADQKCTIRYPFTHSKSENEHLNEKEECYENENEDDDISIYEDTDSNTKTIFKFSCTEAKSIKEEDYEMDDNELQRWNNIKNNYYQKENDFNIPTSLKTFNSEMFTSTYGSHKRHGSTDTQITEMETTFELSDKSGNFIDSPIEDAKDQASGFENDHDTSIDSENSLVVQFDDFVLGNMVNDLKNHKEVSTPKLETLSISELLEFREHQIIEAIVYRLKKELEPTLQKLSEESAKYEMVKSLYKLRSISDLSKETRDEYFNEVNKKQFKLEFDKTIISHMIFKAISDTDSKDISLKAFKRDQIMDAENQVKINFNKFRNLDTILEEAEKPISKNK